MLIFLSGGAKNGKSMLAQRLCRRLSGGGPLYYLATMIPHDAEDEQRIARHVRRVSGGGGSAAPGGHSRIYRRRGGGVRRKALSCGGRLYDPLPRLL